VTVTAIVFVSNLGEIYPSELLPLRCGNVGTGSLVDDRNSEISARSTHLTSSTENAGPLSTATTAEDRVLALSPTPGTHDGG
jgi:hypothetical protein